MFLHTLSYTLTTTLLDSRGNLISLDSIRNEMSTTLDFWYRPSTAEPPPPGVSRYSDDDRTIISTRFSNWIVLVHAALRSKHVDLMIRDKQANPAYTPGWVSTNLKKCHPQYLTWTLPLVQKLLPGVV
jgi:hypothetical protein